MSIVTKTGDAGTTALMFGRRVSKCDLSVEAYGTVDELNAALGLAVATACPSSLARTLRTVQKDLIALMGELATRPRDLARYIRGGYPRITPANTVRVERLVVKTESALGPLTGWALPGKSLGSASLDLARAVCRRAERRVCGLREAGRLRNAEAIVFLNRLGDLLWLLARQAEKATTRATGRATNVRPPRRTRGRARRPRAGKT